MIYSSLVEKRTVCIFLRQLSVSKKRYDLLVIFSQVQVAKQPVSETVSSYHSDQMEGLLLLTFFCFLQTKDQGIRVAMDKIT